MLIFKIINSIKTYMLYTRIPNQRILMNVYLISLVYHNIGYSFMEIHMIMIIILLRYLTKC